MRLQLVPRAHCFPIAALALLLIPSAVIAQEAADRHGVEANFRVYADDDNVTVISPSTSVRLEASDSLDVSIASTVDVVSAASVDVITQASPTPVEDTRIELSSEAVWALSRVLRVRGGGVFSHENDYDSIRSTIGAQLEVAQRNATIDLAYTVSHDRVGSVIDDDFAKTRNGHIVAAAFTQILDSKTYLDIVADLRRFRGYHASPYRLVPVIDPETSALTALGEKTPKSRDSAAGLVGLRRALGPVFLHASYRFYQDDWSVRSHTVGAKVLMPLASERFLLGLGLRGYFQGAADFYRPYYEEVTSYRTRDQTLGGMRSLHASLTLDAVLSKRVESDALRLRGMLSTTHFQFSDYPAQKSRNAMIVGLSVYYPL